LSVSLSRRVFIQRSACISAGMCASLLITRPAAAVIFPGGQTAVIANTGGDSIRLRATPSKSGDVKGNTGEGAIVLITDGPKSVEGASWYQVQYSGQSGWVMADYLGARKLAGYAAVTFTDGQGVHLRDNTDKGAKVLGMVPEGAIVQIVEGPRVSSDGTPWYHVNHAGNHGYLMGTFLVPRDAPVGGKSPQSTETPASKAPEVHKDDRVKIVNTDGAGVRMRSDAAYSAEVLAILDEGTVVTVTGTLVTDTKGSDWVPVSYDGTKGFVVGPYLAKTSDAATKQKGLPAPSASSSSSGTASKTDTTAQSAPATPTTMGAKIVVEAMKYIGTPYVWGGTSPRGFDCSGFMLYSVRQATGKQLPRSTYDQVGAGVYVAKENLQPGDLVFFANTYGVGVTHAGIYLTGGRFIHAENEGTGVVISSINDGYYRTKYYSARRIN